MVGVVGSRTRRRPARLSRPPPPHWSPGRPGQRAHLRLPRRRDRAAGGPALAARALVFLEVDGPPSTAERPQPAAAERERGRSRPQLRSRGIGGRFANRRLSRLDEYGPSIYEFNRRGILVGTFETPAELVPRPAGPLDYVAGRDSGASGHGRQDNRGFEGLAISPDGTRLFATLQDPLIDEGPRTDTTDLTANDGWDARMVRIVVFDNDWRSPRYRQSVAQYVYQLEPQLALRTRILAAGGSASETDPRQGRDIGLCAIAALNAHQFLVIERDNRGIGVTNPAGRGNGAMPALAVVGSKRVFKIDISGATDISAVPLPE